MKRAMATVCTGAILSALGLGWVSGVLAFKLETHKAVNERAAEISGLDEHLKAQLGVSHGINEELNSLRVQKWIGIGGSEEDMFLNNEGGGAYNRSRHHFQNPLLPWDQAGLTGRCLFGLFPIDGLASVRWAQSDVDQAGGSARWSDARRLFLDSLVLPTKLERDSAAADLFKTLGQQMHLVSDLAVPAHSRNDIHCTPGAETFEVWADARENRQLLSTMQAIGPDPSIFTVGVPIQDQIARVPVARLWDTGTYRAQRDADLTLSGPVGLAEYASANFFSKRTIFSPAFPYPARTSVGANLVTGVDPKTGQLRQYFTKVRDGQPLNRLATPGALYNYVPDALKDENIGLDSSIFAEYATHLFPRAIGYSAALLDYFFRGKLEAAIAADPSDQQGLQLTGKNASGEALKDGTLKVYGDYATDGRRELGSWAIVGSVAPGADLPGQPFKFSPPIDHPVPTRYMVVYRGDLGEEKKDNPPGFGGAVIGKAAAYGGVIEELLLFRTNQNTYDVYLRNSNQVVLLNLSERLPVAPYSRLAEVHWGVDSNHFFVKNYEYTTYAGTPIHVPIYHIYRIVRPENQVSGGDPITAEFVKTIQPRETPLPYTSHTVYVNRPQYNSDGQMVYPYGMVFSPPYQWVQAEPSQQEVLSEDLGNGAGLEIYALFHATRFEEIEYVERNGGSGVGSLRIGLIIQASTGAVIYEDPVSASYKPRVTSVSSHGNHATAWFNPWSRTQIVSWSDRNVSKRRWTTEIQVADYFSTYDVLPDDQGGGITNVVDYEVEHSVQTALMETGGVKFFITPPTPYLGPGAEPGDEMIQVFWAASLAPSLSSERYLWIDEPDGFVPFDGLVHRTEYLMSPLTGSKTRVSEWFPGNPGGGGSDNGVPLNMTRLTMLNSGFLYAYDESPASPDERDRFVEFLGSDGEVEADFATLIPLKEDPDLVGKGRVVTNNYPAGFQAALDGIANGTAQIAWHVVPDPDLVPARRR
jgi:hypothetical protein